MTWFFGNRKSLILALSLVSLLWLRSEDLSASYAASAAVRVVSDCGDVDIHAADVPTIVSTTHVLWSFGKPTYTSSLDGDTRVITVRCASLSLGTGNSAALTLTVPTATAVSVRASAGHVLLDGLAGDIDVAASGGRVQGSDLSATHVTATSSAGSVRLTFSASPVVVRAHSSAGSVVVQVPHGGAPYAVTATSSAGRADVSIATDPASPARIDASSSAGDVRVGYSD